MDQKLIVSPSPHFWTRNSTSNIMFDVILAMLPALFVSVVFFGWRSLVVTAVSVAACVVFEWLVRKLMKKSNTIPDLSAVVTGVLLAFNLPVSIPLWIVVLGAFFAIVIAKQLFGGIGQNFANPAITARIMLFVSFGTHMTTWTEPFSWRHGVDVVAGATPLAAGIPPNGTILDSIGGANTLDLFLGSVPGCLGEVSALALLCGGVYLVFRKVIHPGVPLMFVGTVFVLGWLLGPVASGNPLDFATPLNFILAGGLFLGAIFMATDYSTTPATIKGKLIFAFGCGVITVLIRVYGSYPEGVSFAILLMNLLTPLIDRVTKTHPFGTVRARKEVKRHA